MSLIGLAGAHRVGKTTLAKRFADVSGFRFLETSASATFYRLGCDPKKDYDLEERLRIQRAILEDHIALYANSGVFVVTDRTPIDMGAYMMADITRGTNSALDQALLEYYADCLKATRRLFAAVIVIQPGIKVVEAEGKAPALLSYMEHINGICLGMVTGSLLGNCKTFTLSRNCTGLDDRAEALIRIASELPAPVSVIPYQQNKPM